MCPKLGGQSVRQSNIPLVWDVLPANFYDNQVAYLLLHLDDYEIFMHLDDAVYYDKKLIILAKRNGIRLVTQVNKRRASLPEILKSENRNERLALC